MLVHTKKRSNPIHGFWEMSEMDEGGDVTANATWMFQQCVAANSTWMF